MSKMIIMDSEGSVESQSCILSLVSLLNSVLGHFRDYKMLQAARPQAFAVHSDQCGGGIPSLCRAKHEKTWALNQASKWFHDSLSWPDCISIHKESGRGGLLPAVHNFFSYLTNMLEKHANQPTRLKTNFIASREPWSKTNSIPKRGL